MPFKVLGQLILWLALVSGVFGQDFINGDLEGGISQNATPPNWTSIPHTDPLCLADDEFAASVDVAGTNGPSAMNGILGNPQSGNSFVTGLSFQVSSAGFHINIPKRYPRIPGILPSLYFALQLLTV